MQKQTLKIIVKNTDLNKNAVVNEIRNQKMVAGLPNFIGLKEVFEDNQHIYFFMDPWGKSVADVLQTRILFTERECQFLLSQLIDILDNLRTRSISHGGITLNSLFLSDNNGVNILRLGDFSHSINVVEYCNASLQAGFMHADNDLTSQNLVNLEDKRGN